MFTALLIQFPSLEKFLDNGIIDGIKNLFAFVVDLFVSTAQALQQFYDTLSEVNDVVIAWTSSAAGTGNQLPVVASIGAYRYLVGDGAFYLTYVSLLCGCLFTIFQLLHILAKLLDAQSKKINSGDAKTPTDILSKLMDFFS